MTLHPQPIPPVPAVTAQAVHAAFPKGNVYVDLRAEFGTLFTDETFTDLYPPSGRPVIVAPWRLALVVVMQFMEGLTDRQAADAVRRCMDWKYALSLELTDPGFDFTLLHDFRERLVVTATAHRMLDTLVAACKARGLIKTRGIQRTDATHVLAAVRTLHHLECVLETMHWVLNELTQCDPEWVQAHVPAAWYERYGLRADRMRFPKEQSKRTALATAIATDGYTLMDWLASAETPGALRECLAVEVLRQIWIQQFYRCTIPGHEAMRPRTMEEKPATAMLIQSPYDLEARYSSKRDTHWTGYKVHLTETCDDGHPDLIIQVTTTSATTQDCTLGPALHDDLADRGLLPAIHLLDGGYVDSNLLVRAQRHQIAVIGPTFGSYSRQHREDQGFALSSFPIDWDAQTIECPQGHTSVKWTPGHTITGAPCIRVRFGKATCRACPVRARCTSAKDEPRQLTILPKEQHHALYEARAREQTSAFKHQYALRAGVESTMAQGTGRFGMRRSRYRGLARTQLHQILSAVAMNLCRMIAWLWDQPLDTARRNAGSFAALSPRILSRRTELC